MNTVDYDPETGIFTWPKTLKNQWAGKQAGTIVTKGYRQIMLGQCHYMAHRLAWFLVTGQWPSSQIDHINGIKDDNRFANLREASNRENKQNSSIRADNTSGFKGVSYSKQACKWSAYIYVNGKQKKLGLFARKENAALAYNFAALEYFGKFARFNRS